VLLPSLLLLLFFMNDSNDIYRGLGLNLVDKAFADSSTNGLDIWDPLIKSLLTTFCLSSGFKGGEVTPLLAIGASSGYALADVLGVQTQAAAAVGYPLLFAVVFSVPLSCIALSFEVFGFENGVSGAVLCLFLLFKNYFRQS
jgi:H+/Cl- antiporter ClcA